MEFVVKEGESWAWAYCILGQALRVGQTQIPLTLYPSPRSQTRGERECFLVRVYPGLRTSEKRSQRADVLTLGYSHGTPTEFSVWLAAASIRTNAEASAARDRGPGMQ